MEQHHSLVGMICVVMSLLLNYFPSVIRFWDFAHSSEAENKMKRSVLRDKDRDFNHFSIITVI